MFLSYRIRKLKIKVEVQKALVDNLQIAEKQYASSYYTDMFHKAVCKYVELNSKLKYLKGKQGGPGLQIIE
jgi:hypothetical protein